MVAVKSVTAQQRYPWNGLVDIVVTIQGEVGQMDDYECTFVATNCATKFEVNISAISQIGTDFISGDICTRRFIWDAATDIGTVKIDDLALTVDVVRGDGGVQLWENGPYWAKCNVGATKPEEYGYYFWWGDIVGCKRNASNSGWVSVKDGKAFEFYNSNCPTWGKRNSTLQSLGYIDATGNLVAAHDAATQHLGSPWRMPTSAEIDALISNSTTTWTTRNGVYGWLVTGKGSYASKRIFLPAAGYGNGSDLYRAGSNGYFWTSTPNSQYLEYARYLCFIYSSTFTRYYYCREFGQSVRPLRECHREMAVACFSIHLKLDCRTGERMVSAEGETIYYDRNWYDNADKVNITDDGIEIVSGTIGAFHWRPSSCGRHTLQLSAKASDGSQIGAATAQYVFDHAEVVTTTALKPTCTENGWTKGAYCSRCKAVLSVSTNLVALGHVEIGLSAKEPTCTIAGCKQGTVCERCGIVMTGGEEIPPLGHLPIVTKQAVSPTTIAAGYTEEIQCSRCDAILHPSEEIPPIVYVRDVQARQLWPHKKVGVEFTVTDDVGNITNENTKLVLQCEVGGEIIPAEKIYGDMTIAKGRHHVIWDLEAQGVTIKTSSAKFRVGVSGAEVPDTGLYADALYCVVDLSGGPTATSYPVTYLSDVPSGGWSDEYKTSKLVLRYIAPGTFVMGSPEDEYIVVDGENMHTHESDETQREVTLTQGFWIGVFEVTQRQYELVTGENPSYFKNLSYYAKRPIERVSYTGVRSGGDTNQTRNPPFGCDVLTFIGRMRCRTGIHHFDLPSEAQWEYACRAGTSTPFNSGGIGRYMANGGINRASASSDCSAGTAEVGSYGHNSWGLYDMHGNVSEWCYDIYDATYGIVGIYGKAVTDPYGASSGSYRVVRGGSWMSGDARCRSANRTALGRAYAEKDIGFRLCCMSELIRK